MSMGNGANRPVLRAPYKGRFPGRQAIQRGSSSACKQLAVRSRARLEKAFERDLKSITEAQCVGHMILLVRIGRTGASDTHHSALRRARETLAPSEITLFAGESVSELRPAPNLDQRVVPRPQLTGHINRPASGSRDSHARRHRRRCWRQASVAVAHSGAGAAPDPGWK